MSGRSLSLLSPGEQQAFGLSGGCFSRRSLSVPLSLTRRQGLVGVGPVQEVGVKGPGEGG